MSDHQSEILAGASGDLLTDLADWVTDIRKRMPNGAVYEFDMHKVKRCVYFKVKWRDPDDAADPPGWYRQINQA